ncbi:phenylacetic acid degradation bifunctional protein PaaZ [Microbacterium sp. EYE_5]|uniref:phenylacetic acid degradation bifunctional protein PaaZ n=1 Tax=unclassified Microbacterium TaxID=2609290 RepID=UPI002005F926|nr:MULTISPECIES: phenylacetic acid degradation bifunctional protein PaaZ [unclassified Microbacterium]MCK6080783.1 phenylacetic acid degradation bifunctional protein PaaZ [Microbacterium sp. EYE_382]MCK6086054.1 phenylacetic acid degradation bifunctional protein PaaZ [Microbacterium sp. EYE_384]MCK6124448.1 phenylacetic acid degradation bifunctional protein PaaZ [Microbacterium sp. EYE_80]MCK6127357.1 phenylacetic acid degradation bifunctional protein PaaZ [Microbacterium sp. EYE_79]MCK6141738
MSSILPSYVRDGWWTPPALGDVTEVQDASTGAVVARVSTAGIDVPGVLDHGRTVGQRSLGALTFHERAMLLKQFALALSGRKEELYALSMHSGSTRRDSLSDVDGGIGVLFTYSSKGRRELPNARVVVDGPVEPLSKDGSFLGEHVFTRLPGVAVQINAFNFPMWGALEKFAPAFLAGVPTIVKPATPTVYVAEAWVRILVETGLLPDGSLQLVSGRFGDVLDHLRLGDLVGFTGSASTAARLRDHPRIESGEVRFTSETDSINASVLGPDARPGTPEFDAFVSQLMVELTTKAGQKCTAIRRAIVPAGVAGDVADALRTKIESRVVIGDPRADGVTMGPLVSLAQRDDVLRQVAKLQDAGGHLLVGSTDAPQTVRADGTVGVTDDGAFLAPMLLAFADPTAPAAHEVEAFGPVASILEYDSIADAADLVARGGGSLVTSVVTHDQDVAVELLTRIGAFNGRVLFLSRENARTSTGHGAPVPHLVHGGPGRAGGGEELGGIRAVLHHMQRTAIQGSPDMLTAITGVWHAGAAHRVDGTHPFRKSLADLRIGDGIESVARTVSLADIETFAEFTGDTFYAHMDEESAAANPFFPGRVAHGYLLVSWAAGLFVDPDPGPVLANYGLENLRFITPVSPGDEIRVALTAKQITPRETDEYGEVRWDAVIRNQQDEIVATYDVLTLVAKTDAEPRPEVVSAR